MVKHKIVSLLLNQTPTKHCPHYSSNLPSHPRAPYSCSPPYTDTCLSVYRLSDSIDLKSPFRHLGFRQELEREPDEMPLDLRQFLPRVGYGEELVENVAGFDSLRGQISIVVFKGFDLDLLVMC